MKEIALLITGCAATFVLFCFLVIRSYRKKSKQLAWSALVILLICIGLGSWTVIRFAEKSYDKAADVVKQGYSQVTESLEPRTGDEIYAALFGAPPPNCVNVLHYQDQNVPVLDYAIWLHVECCAGELDRILEQHTFTSERVSTHGWNNTGPHAGQNWFKPESLGDTVLVFSFSKDEYGNGQFIYSSLDSTHFFCKDVWD